MTFSNYELEMQSEENAVYDYYSEAYGNEVESIENLKAEFEADCEQENKEDLDKMEARGGPEFYFGFTDLTF